MKKPYIFNSNEVESFFKYQIKMIKNISKSFDFVYDKLVTKKYYKNFDKVNKVDFEKLKWREGKSYNWVAISKDNIEMVIRQYDTHFTVYCKHIKRKIFNDIEFDDSKFSAFFFYSDRGKMEGNLSDRYLDNPFMDLNEYLFKLFDAVNSNNIGMLWNSTYLPRANHLEIKEIFTGDTIYSYDNIIFCGEEISSMHVTLFAENEMIELLRKIKDSNKTDLYLGSEKNKIEEINLEFPKQYDEPYYHAIGIKSTTTSYLQDVYSLTRYSIDDVLKLVDDI